MRPFYATTAYASAFGLEVVDVEEWRTALLVRQIPGSTWRDALGCYPLALVHPRGDLQSGLSRLRATGLVSVALVPDPLNGPPSEALAAAFPVCRPFKTHYLIDREAGPVQFAPTHRRMIRKAVKACSIGLVNLRDTLEEWKRLYAHTVTRHRITGIQKFAPSYFTALADAPEVFAFAAQCDGQIVAMILWVRSGDTAYAHLEGSSIAGYKTQAIYGIFAAANDYFHDCRFLHFGGTAGVADRGYDGLAYFKRGFANRHVTSYFCGSYLDSERCGILMRNQPETSFFPAYRQS